MKKRSRVTLIFLLMLSIMLLANSAVAGSKQRHRWEGVAIGIGAALLGSALYHHNKSYTRYEPAPVHVSKRPHPPRRWRRPRGHWKIVKEWVPPTYKQVWNPGHYDRHGEWVDGDWIEIIDQPGYWVKKRVFVSRRYRRY